MLEELQSLGTPEDEESLDDLYSAATDLVETNDKQELAAERGEDRHRRRRRHRGLPLELPAAAAAFGLEDCGEEAAGPPSTPGTLRTVPGTTTPVPTEPVPVEPEPVPVEPAPAPAPAPVPTAPADSGGARSRRRPRARARARPRRRRRHRPGLTRPRRAAQPPADRLRRGRLSAQAP